jgi:SAM-dependent methyltransferase
MLHEMHLIQMDGALHNVPLPEEFSGQILDIGTGTGRWCRDMGDTYPASIIRGVDLSPTQSEWIPPNVFFEVDDVEADWTYTTKFDYIHCRSMTGSIRDWPSLTAQCYSSLKPGGWVEFAEWHYEPFLPNGIPDKRNNDVVRWHGIMNTCLEEAGITAKPGPDLTKWIKDAGFGEMEELVFNVPIGRWPKDPKLKQVGQWYMASLSVGLEGISLRTFTQVAGMSLEEVHVTNAKFRQSMKDIRFYHKL